MRSFLAPRLGPLSLSAALLLTSLPAPAAAGAAIPGGAGPWAEADELYRTGRWEAAIERCRSRLEVPGDRYDAHWRLARLFSERSMEAAGEDSEAWLRQALGHARQALRLRSEGAEGHLWLSASLGRYALTRGPRRGLRLVPAIKRAADRALRLDPGLDCAYHVRGLWKRRLANLSFLEKTAALAVLGGVPQEATMEGAIRDLESAVRLEPEFVNHRLELGRTYWMARRHADAERELVRALSLPPVSGPRDRALQAEARSMLPEIRRWLPGSAESRVSD